MSKTLLLALLLPGCSVLFEAQGMGADPGPDGGDPAAHLGTYSAAFEVVAICSVSVFAADTLDITPEGLTFRSVSCPEHTDTFAAATATSADTLSVDSLELWNCEKTVRYEVAPFVLAFAGAEGFAEVQADQYIPPQFNIICAGEFTLSAVK